VTGQYEHRPLFGQGRPIRRVDDVDLEAQEAVSRQ
jgi:hypothetical protein